MENLIVLLLVFTVFYYLCKGNQIERFGFPSRLPNGSYTRNFHRYPFTPYSLYGYDDYYPQLRYDIEPQTNKKMIQQEWELTKGRRRTGYQYPGLPSYNYVRQVGYSV